MTREGAQRTTLAAAEPSKVKLLASFSVVPSRERKVAAIEEVFVLGMTRGEASGDREQSEIVVNVT